MPRPRRDTGLLKPNVYKMSQIFVTLNFGHFDEFPNALQYAVHDYELFDENNSII